MLPSPFTPSARAAAPGSFPCRDTGWEDTGRPQGCREDVLLEDWGWVLWGLAPRGCRGCVLHKALADCSTLGTSGRRGWAAPAPWGCN